MDNHKSRPTNPTPLIPIIVDDRERQSAVYKCLQADNRFAVNVDRLSTGDYRLDNRFLIERKTLPDLVTSVITGRLFEQALRLVGKHNSHPILILEGTSAHLNGSEMSWEALQGALANVSVFMGLPILRTRNAAETVKTFLYLANQSRAIATGGLPRRGYRPKGKDALRRHILQGLPGVGAKRAATLLKRFGTIEAVMTAEADELAEVAGIGRETARTIRDAVKERPAAYIS